MDVTNTYITVYFIVSLWRCRIATYNARYGVVQNTFYSTREGLFVDEIDNVGV